MASEVEREAEGDAAREAEGDAAREAEGDVGERAATEPEPRPGRKGKRPGAQAARAGSASGPKKGPRQGKRPSRKRAAKRTRAEASELELGEDDEALIEAEFGSESGSEEESGLEEELEAAELEQAAAPRRRRKRASAKGAKRAQAQRHPRRQKRRAKGSRVQRLGPATEAELNVPNRSGLIMIASICGVCLVLWSAARLGCNPSTPLDVRFPVAKAKLVTATPEEVMREPKGAAVEFAYRVYTLRYQEARQLAGPEAGQLVDQLAASCQASAGCTAQARAQGKVWVQGELLTHTGSAATVRVIVNFHEGKEQRGVAQLVRAAQAWKVTAYEPEPG